MPTHASNNSNHGIYNSQVHISTGPNQFAKTEYQSDQKWGDLITTPKMKEYKKVKRISEITPNDSVKGSTF